MNDPTYCKELINKDPIWELAFSISEIENDNAPLGWSKYIGLARCILANYEVRRRKG